MKRRVMVGMLLPVFLILSRGTAEASRYDFNGASNGEIIVWDGSFDVSTESNDCNATTHVCNTTVQGGAFSVLLTGPGASITTFTAIAAILMSSTASCDGIDPSCGPFSQFFSDSGDPHQYNYLFGGFSELTPDEPGVRRTQTDALQSVPNLLFVWFEVGPGFDGQVYEFLTPGQNGTEINDFASAADLRVGILATFTQENLQLAAVGDESFALEIFQESTTVPGVVTPEPASLMLMGSGLVMAAMRRRQARRRNG